MKITPEIIKSRQNPTVKWASSLSQKKHRDEYGVFIAEGEKLTVEAAEAGLEITHVFVMESRRERVMARIEDAFGSEKYKNTSLVVLADDVFEKISTEKAPQGVISVIKYLDFFRELDIIYKEDFFLAEGERALALSSVRDPGNLGSVIRSAVAFGVDHIILSGDSADIYNPKTVRSAMGSLYRVKVTTVNDLASFVISAKENGRRVFAAELSENAKPLGEVGATSTDVFMIGNEGHGIPAELSAITSGSVYIPISKRTESLNAAVAAAIFMWEQSK